MLEMKREETDEEEEEEADGGGEEMKERRETPRELGGGLRHSGEMEHRGDTGSPV